MAEKSRSRKFSGNGIIGSLEIGYPIFNIQYSIFNIHCKIFTIKYSLQNQKVVHFFHTFGTFFQLIFFSIVQFDFHDFFDAVFA